MIAAFSALANRGIDASFSFLAVAGAVLIGLLLILGALLFTALVVAMAVLLTVLPVVATDGHWLGWVGALAAGLFSGSVLLGYAHSAYLFLIED